MMKKQPKLTKELCSGSGMTIAATPEDVQFRLIMCPVCRRQNLSAVAPRRGGFADDFAADCVTVPSHRARVIFGQPPQDHEHATKTR
jgi:hypothetical protein